MNNNIDDIKHTILDKKKEILFIQKISEKNIKIFLSRIKKEINNTYKYSISKFIINILPDIDNLEKALELSKLKDEFDDITLGLEKILNNFLNLLKEYHVNVINNIHVPFDPTIHQAIALSPSKDVKSNYIISIMQKGYKVHNRLIRPAMVLVSQ